MPPTSPARRLWMAIEPLHAVTYFAPECLDGFVSTGLRGFWRGYFAGRACPLGAVGAGPVAAAFHNFHPSMVERALPGVWSLCPPWLALEARWAGASAAFGRILGSPPVDEATTILYDALPHADPAGRALFAGNALLDKPSDPLAALWQATTTWREHRGDGHVMALVEAGVGGCAAHVLVAASGAVARETLQPVRGWSDDDWAAATEQLQGRGWVDAAGCLTATGADARASIEDRTDELAWRPWSRVPEKHVERLLETLEPLAAVVADAGVLPFPNPIGLPHP